jgi:hypothetical protein
MAEMGQGKVSEKTKTGSTLTMTLPVSRTSLLVPVLRMESTTVLVGSALGTPIMREGFTTETGLLPPSVISATAILPRA